MRRQYLNIDVDGTGIKSALTDHSGSVSERNHVLTPCQEETLLATILAVVEPILGKVTVTCASLPGIANPTIGEVKFTGALGFMETFNSTAYLEPRAHCPVYVGNGTDYAALARMWLSSPNSINNGAIATLGTSVDGGIVINNQLLRGPRSQAGELSATIIGNNAPELHYSTMGTATSTVRMVEATADICDTKDETDGRQVSKEVNCHNLVTQSLSEESCRRVAVLILNIQTVVDLRRVLIGGDISTQETLIDGVKEQFTTLRKSDYRLHDDVTVPEIMTTKSGSEANLLDALHGLLLTIE